MASSSFCLRYLIQHLIKTKPELITRQFAAKFTNLAIKRSIVQSNFVEMLRDLMRHFNEGLTGITTTNGKQMFEYSINTVRNLMSAFEQRGGHLFGHQLQDIMALLKLQKNMVEGSEAAAKYVIPYHYADALRALEAFRMIRNTTI